MANLKENVLETLSSITSEDGRRMTVLRLVVYEFDKGKTPPRIEKVIMFKNQQGNWYFGKRPGLEYDDIQIIGAKWAEIKDKMKP
jgi:hypothetical protein